MSKIAASTLILAGLFFIYFSADSESKPIREQRILVNSEILPHTVLGFKSLAADLFWIRLVQEIDYSENKGGPLSKGWTFHMLDSVTTLDPRYKIAYRAGATVLSVLVKDVEGARIIFERGISNFPEDWPLLYRAGYHYLYEVKECKRAAELFSLAAKHGAPDWLNSLTSRLYEKAGQFELAKAMLLDALEKFKESAIQDSLKKRLAELEDHKLEFQSIPCN